tara:strand:+ start:9756 stop:10739 length:984 start_codon:yes stop_codon:yes gene_type:complete
MHRLPPLNALKAFEVAGRHMSFSRAAEELHVTPAAISHQIKALETDLGVKLFRRLNRSLQLTEAGQACLPGLRSAFETMASAVGRVRDKEDWNVLTISAPPAFGARWLVPRIVDFRTANPQIQVRIDPAIRSMDPVRDSVDVAIEFSQGHYSGRSVQRSAQRLFGQDVFPVCSPELLDGKNPLTTPDDLRGHTLIHFDAPMDDPGWPNWETWLRANNVDRLDPNKGPHFTSPNFTTQALLAGHGVALMAELVVESELATGTLVKPFDISYPGDLSYWALATSVDSEDDPVTLFWNWLTREASRYVREKQMQSQFRPTADNSPDPNVS